MESRDKSVLLEFWKKRVGQYVLQKRIAAGLGQKEMTSLSKSAWSEIENGNVNFTLETILDALGEVNGNISDAFAIRVPRRWRGEHELLHEQLQSILTEGSADQSIAAAALIQALVDQMKAARSGPPRKTGAG